MSSASPSAFSSNLERLTDRYHMVAEQNRTVFWEVDTEGCFTYVSHVSEIVWGYTPSEVVGRHFYDLHPEEGREKFKEIGLTEMRSRRPFQGLRNPVQRKDGSIVWVATNGVPVIDSQGNLEGYRGSDTDVTAWYRTEQALQQESARLASVIEGTNAGLWEWNIQSGEVILNERWAEILGYSLSELEQSLGNPVTIDVWYRFAHPEDLQRSNQRLADHFAGKVPHYDTECRMKHRNGEWVWVHDRGKVVEWDVHGKPLRMAGTHTDITARKLAELELVSSRERAESATRAKSQFLSTISHELRTPLTGIIGMSELLLESGLSAEQQTFARAIRGSSDTLLSLISDILDFARIEAGKLPVESLPFDLRNEVNDIVVLLRPVAHVKGLALDYFDHRSLSSLLLLGDKGRIRQILLNLVGNAIKFTDRGAITIDMHSCSREETPAAANPYQWIRIEVRDTGIGIPPEELPNLFQSFTQLDSSSTRRHGGTGLGLAIAKGLAHVLGGDIHVSSALGEGSTFTLEIPLRQVAANPGNASTADCAEPQPSAAGAAPEPEPLADAPRVLVVDDNATNRLLASALLRKIGCIVEEAAHGRQALDLVQQNEFRLILMDCQMPVLDGFEATARIRALPAPHCSIPIIALTASAHSSDRERCHAAGMNGYLSKPYKLESLRELVRRHSFSI